MNINDNQSRQRYSDEDLAEFDEMLKEKLVVAKELLEELQGQLSDLNNSGDENRAGTFDDGASNWQREHISKLASRQQKFVRNLEHALVRIKNKTYGVCITTGKLISKERLKLVPHATKSIDGKKSSQGTAKKRFKPLSLNKDRK
ncbi:MAG: TraR/DksA family transcriptional regulator [Aureispira sp.]|nr:TraR/DksA family transcriptional regulator [Aureispira sp.]